MDRYLSRHRSRSVSTDNDRPDSRLSSVRFRASTPVSDREMDQSQHSDASMSLGAESLRDTNKLREALFPKEHREAWVDLFIKYNTPLPSSAAVERMFSTAGDILRPMRAALASENFEKLVFLKGNMSLLGYPSYKGQFGEEEQ